MGKGTIRRIDAGGNSGREEKAESAIFRPDLFQKFANLKFLGYFQT
jgi:hypothetical protein